MAGENSEPGNPLDQGSDPHSVEHAAADFSAMIQDEERPRPKKDREKPASRAPEESDDTAESDERQPKADRSKPSATDEPESRRPVDPILDNPEGTEDKGDDEDEDPDDEDEDRDDGPDDDGDDDDEDPEETLLSSKIKVKVNGEEREVTVQEARDGYMRQQDYSQLSERNAREYEEVETFAAETVEHRQRALRTIDETLALMEALQPKQADWDYMKANDPEGYIKAQEHWQNEIVAKAKTLFETRQQLVNDEGTTNQKRDAKYFQTQERKLHEKLPQLRDEKKADAFRAAIMEYGIAAGYTEQELRDGAVDHRDLITLYKAAQYDKSRKGISDAGRRAGSKAPKPSNDGRARVPGNRPRGAPNRNADKRLARTGSLADAADSFAEMIRRE